MQQGYPFPNLKPFGKLFQSLHDILKKPNQWWSYAYRCYKLNVPSMGDVIAVSPYYETLSEEEKLEYKTGLRRIMNKKILPIAIFITFLYRIVAWFKFDSVEFRENTSLKLKGIDKHKINIFLANHLSLFDNAMLPAELHCNLNITTPLVASSDFLSSNLIANACCGFFIKTRKSGDEIYKIALKDYIRSLMLKDIPILLFPQGQFSHTGNPGEFKLGFIKLLLEIHRESGFGKDIDFHILNPVYDYTPTDREFLEDGSLWENYNELTPEEYSAWWKLRPICFKKTIRGHKYLKRNFGKATILFEDTISLTGLDIETVEPIVLAKKVAFAGRKTLSEPSFVGRSQLLSHVVLGFTKELYTSEISIRSLRLHFERVLEDIRTKGLEVSSSSLDELLGAAAIQGLIQCDSENVYFPNKSDYYLLAFYRNQGFGGLSSYDLGYQGVNTRERLQSLIEEKRA